MPGSTQSMVIHRVLGGFSIKILWQYCGRLKSGYILPKHYYWHRGFDGMCGTIHRWVQKFVEWNPSLAEEDGFALSKSPFGLELPGIHSLLDLEVGFPDEFFSEVVYNETRRALDAVQDDDL